jgi:hypothetical protein
MPPFRLGRHVPFLLDRQPSRERPYPISDGILMLMAEDPSPVRLLRHRHGAAEVFQVHCSPPSECLLIHVPNRDQGDAPPRRQYLW